MAPEVLTKDKKVVVLMNGTSALKRIREARESYRESERKVADFVLTHAKEAIHLPITELAEQVGVSEATIVRMCKKAGFTGFQELKIVLAMESVGPFQTVHEEIQEGDDIESVFEKVFSSNIRAMEATKNLVDVAALKRAIEVLASADQIVIFGVGGSGPVAMDAAHKLMKTGKPVLAYVDSHMQAMAASLLGPNAAVIGISHSGSSRDVIESLGLARAKGATTIGITHYARTPMDKVLDIKLPVSSNESFYRMESTSSRIAQLCIIDALFIGISLRDVGNAISRIRQTREAIVPKRF